MLIDAIISQIPYPSTNYTNGEISIYKNRSLYWIGIKQILSRANYNFYQAKCKQSEYTRHFKFFILDLDDPNCISKLLEWIGC